MFSSNQGNNDVTMTSRQNALWVKKSLKKLSYREAIKYLEGGGKFLFARYFLVVFEFFLAFARYFLDHFRGGSRHFERGEGTIQKDDPEIQIRYVKKLPKGEGRGGPAPKTRSLNPSLHLNHWFGSNIFMHEHFRTRKIFIYHFSFS